LLNLRECQAINNVRDKRGTVSELSEDLRILGEAYANPSTSDTDKIAILDALEVKVRVGRTTLTVEILGVPFEVAK
jgi:hypothetical protein